MAIVHPKNQKLKVYYATTSGTKPNLVYARHYIHTKESQGLWASVRDLSARELLGNEAIAQQRIKLITIGHNPIVLSRYSDLVFVNDAGDQYRAKAAPDAYFEDTKSDIRITAYLIHDTNNYTGEDVYEQ